MREDDWFILRVQPSQEVLAADFLNYELAAETYFPIEVGKKIIRGKLTEYTKAAFAGYIYARFNSDPDWRRVSEHCRAKPRLIMREGSGEDSPPHPLYEHDAAIERLRRLEAMGRYALGMENPTIQKLVGQIVTIPSGVFMGQKGTVVSIVEDIVKVSLRTRSIHSVKSFCFDEIFTRSNMPR